jgi:hypothetical protein
LKLCLEMMSSLHNVSCFETLKNWKLPHFSPALNRVTLTLLCDVEPIQQVLFLWTFLGNIEKLSFVIVVKKISFQKSFKRSFLMCCVSHLLAILGNKSGFAEVYTLWCITFYLSILGVRTVSYPERTSQLSKRQQHLESSPFQEILLRIRNGILNFCLFKSLLVFQRMTFFFFFFLEEVAVLVFEFRASCFLGKCCTT